MDLLAVYPRHDSYLGIVWHSPFRTVHFEGCAHHVARAIAITEELDLGFESWRPVCANVELPFCRRDTESGMRDLDLVFAAGLAVGNLPGEACRTVLCARRAGRHSIAFWPEYGEVGNGVLTHRRMIDGVQDYAAAVDLFAGAVYRLVCSDVSEVALPSAECRARDPGEGLRRQRLVQQHHAQ